MGSEAPLAKHKNFVFSVSSLATPMEEVFEFADQKLRITVGRNDSGFLRWTVAAEATNQFRRCNVKFSVLDGEGNKKEHQEIEWSREAPLKIDSTLPVLVDALNEKNGYVNERGELSFLVEMAGAELRVPEKIPFAGLLNQGATCYMNSLLQSLYHIPAFRSLIYQMDSRNPDKTDDQNVCLNLQRLFGMMQLYGQTCETCDLTKSFGWGDADAFMQHDVQEFCRVLLDNLEMKMKKTPLEGRIARLFSGKCSRYVRCVNVEYESRHEDVFYDLSLDVSEEASYLEHSFEKYVEQERLEGNNQYNAEGFGLQDAVMGVEFTALPLILHLHLRRFQYDYTTNRMIKINSLFAFPVEIDLEKFMAKDADRSVPYLYELVGVLVHWGGPTSGHYYAYLRAGEQLKWYKFDDSHVTLATEKEAIEGNFGGKDPDHPEMPERIYSAYMLIYVAKHAIPELFGDITNDEVPQPIVKYVESMKELDRKRREEEIERQQTVTGWLIDHTSVRAYAREGRMLARRYLNDETKFTFKTYDTLDVIYAKAAQVLHQNPADLYLFKCGDTLSHLLNRGCTLTYGKVFCDQKPANAPITFYVYTRQELERTHRLFPGYDPIESIQKHHVIFIMAYVYEASQPLQLAFVTPLPEISVMEDIANAFRSYYHLDSNVELNAYLGSGFEAKEASDSLEADDIETGSFLVFEPTEPIQWPAGVLGEGSSGEEEEVEQDEDGPIICYKGPNPKSFLKYLRDRREPSHIQIESCNFRGTFQFPKSLKIMDFRKFIGKKIDKAFHPTGSSLLFYSGLSKDPLCFGRNDRVRDELSKLDLGEDGYALSLWCLPDMDETLLEDACNITVYMNSSISDWFHSGGFTRKKSFLLPRSMKISGLFERLKQFSPYATVPLRAHRWKDWRMDCIYNPDTEIGDSAVVNPITIEPIPSDQQEMADEDKLIPMVHMRWLVGDVNQFCQHLSYFKVIPSEKFEDSEKRHRMMLSNPSFTAPLQYSLAYLDARDIRRLGPNDVLYDMIDEMPGVCLKVVIPQDPAVYDACASQRRSDVKLFN